MVDELEGSLDANLDGVEDLYRQYPEVQGLMLKFLPSSELNQYNL